MPLYLDIEAGETFSIKDRQETFITLEQKSGRRARIRIDAPNSVEVQSLNRQSAQHVMSQGLTKKG